MTTTREMARDIYTKRDDDDDDMAATTTTRDSTAAHSTHTRVAAECGTLLLIRVILQ